MVSASKIRDTVTSTDLAAFTEQCSCCKGKGEHIEQHGPMDAERYMCDDCGGTGVGFLFDDSVRVPCSGYEYYGHELLDIVGDYATCEYVGKDWRSDADPHAPGNQRVAALVREALQRNNPLDEWLDDELNKAHLGDTAIRECAYLTVMTNIPHPPCQGRGWNPSENAMVWLEAMRLAGYAVLVKISYAHRNEGDQVNVGTLVGTGAYPVMPEENLRGWDAIRTGIAYAIYKVNQA